MMSRLVRSLVLLSLAVLLFAVVTTAQSPQPSPQPNIGGIWVLDPSLTQKPAEVGFSPDWARPSAGGDGTRSAGGGGRGRRGGGGSAAPMNGLPVSRESADDSTRVQQLTMEARTPPAHITIVQKPDAVSIADDQGHSRTFHPTGQVEDLTIGTVVLPTTSKWDSGGFVVSFEVETGREIRYTFTPAANPSRLQVDIRFIDHGKEGDQVKLTYTPPDEQDRLVLSGTPILPSAPTSPPSGAPAGALPTAPEPAVNAATGAPAAGGARLPPGSELRGINTIAVEVDDLSAQGAACGLDQTKIKTSVTKILSDAGFKMLQFGNEDADVLVNVVTSRLSDGTCVSRYDASLVSHADANFPYLKGTVSAVEVQLLHDGGMAGGSPAAHAASVMDGLAKSVSHFASQIHPAAK
jgi:hypothetical protein